MQDKCCSKEKETTGAAQGCKLNALVIEDYATISSSMFPTVELDSGCSYCSCSEKYKPVQELKG